MIMLTEKTFGEIAVPLAANGYEPVPIIPGEKRPAPDKWQQGGWENHTEQFEKNFTGLLTRYLPAVDIDVSDPELVNQIRNIVYEVVGCHEVPPPRRIGNAPRELLVFRTEEPFPKVSTAGYRLRTDVAGADGKTKASKVEILADGQQFVSYAIHPDTQKPYYWNGGGEPLEVERSRLVRLDQAQAREIIDRCEALLSLHGYKVERESMVRGALEDRVPSERQEADDPILALAALGGMPNPNLPFDDWLRCLYAAKGGLGDEGFGAFMAWSAKSMKHDPEFAEREWKKAKPTRIGAGSLIWMAKQLGWSPVKPLVVATTGTFKPLTVPEIKPDADRFQQLLKTIENCSDLDLLLSGVVAEIQNAAGIDSDMSLRLADALKKQSVNLGYALKIDDARAKCQTKQQSEVFQMKLAAIRHNEARGRPVLYVGGGALASNAIVCSKVMFKECFYRGGSVTRIQETPTGKACVSVTAQWVARELTERILFTTENGNADCPDRLARVLTKGAGDDFYLPLAGIARAPFMRDDGSLCTVNGYDDDTGLWLDLRMDVPPINETPTKADAQAALGRLLELVQDFPFATDIARSAWLADLLGAIARANLPTMPVSVYTAPMPGTGKSLLCTVVNLIAYGEQSLGNWPSSEEELGKMLTSALDAGDSYIGFDNVPNGLGVHSAVLSQFVTTSNYQDRRLGFTERVRYRNRMRVVMTGNNISLTNDCARRGLNRPGFRGGQLVKVRPCFRSSRRVADSSFPPPRPVEYTQSAPAVGCD